MTKSKTKHLLALLGFSTLFTGCSTGSMGPLTRSDFEVVSADEEFAIVRLSQGQSVTDVAEIFLGGKAEVAQIAEVNAGETSRAGSLLAVPLSPVNPTGVYRDFYQSVPILCYHQFTKGSRAKHKLELRARDFEAQLRFMRDQEYQFLSFAELKQIMAGERAMPAKAVVLTIDDGYRSVYDVAWPILKKYNAKATLFVYTDFVGGGSALSWAQLKELSESDLIEVESHGKSHSSLSRLPEDSTLEAYKLRLAAELSGSEAAFMARLGRAPQFLSYPYGNSSRVIADLLRDSGYQLAATVTRGVNASFVDPFLLHRTMIYDGHDLGDLKSFLRSKRRRTPP